MARRPPIDDKALLRLLEEGQGQSEAARTLDYPVGTVTARVKKLRDRGILKPGDEVDWTALEAWEGEHRSKAYQQKRRGKESADDTEGDAQVIPKVIPGITQFNEKETKALREVIGWWEKQEGNTQVIPEVIRKGNTVIPEGMTSKSRRTFWIEDGLYEALKEGAQQQGVSMADLVNQALRVYLEGHAGGINER